MLAILSLVALALLIGLVVRHGFRDLAEVEKEARRDRMLRAVERERSR